MDAVNFLKEYNKMCDTLNEDCAICPVNDYCGMFTSFPEQLVVNVEKWSKENPQKTMLQDYFEKFS